MSAGNPIVRWFEALTDEEKSEYDLLAEAGRLYGSDAEAEARALADGTHPLSGRRARIPGSAHGGRSGS